jgi:molybdopterin-biosynthesis enzyme MoeA-like protein
MHARQLSIGDELFASALDRNGPRIAEGLADLGVEVVERVTVGDGLDALTAALEGAGARDRSGSRGEPALSRP